MNKIVVVGSSNVDLIMKMDHLPKKGETVTDAFFLQVYGGKGANQAVAAARAGGCVTFINCTGEDAYTPQMIRNFEIDGIDTRFIFRENGIASGHALVMIDDQGNNYLSVAPGANYKLTPAKIDAALEAFDEAEIIILQYEIPEETIKYVINLAGSRNIPILWNFAPARAFDLSYIPKANILVLNEVEAGFLAQISVSNQSEAEMAAQILIDKGVKQVIITLGAKGAIAFTQKERIYVPAFQVNAIDTTAAGDTFCGSFAVAFVEGKSLKESLIFASAASAISVTRIGAQQSIPNRFEIEHFYQV